MTNASPPGTILLVPGLLPSEFFSDDDTAEMIAQLGKLNPDRFNQGGVRREQNCDGI